MNEPVHLHTNRLNRNFNVFLLLIPSIVFILVLASLYINYARRYKRQEIAIKTESTSSVLGEESDLDNTEQKLSK